jgi:hypothetical protein
MEQNNRHSYGQLGVGIFLLAAGIALLFDKFDIFNVGSVWHYWPIIIIIAGLGRLMDARLAWEYRKACRWLFIGTWLLVSELHLFGLHYHDSWPILLIGIGISMFWKSAYPCDYKFAKDHCHGN